MRFKKEIDFLFLLSRRHGSLSRLAGITLAASLAQACLVPPPNSSYQQDHQFPPRPAPALPPRNARAARPLYPVLLSQVLPSGMRIVLEQDFYAQAVGVVSVVQGGFASDPEGVEGISHLVEHLTFRAIDSKPDAPLPLTTGKLSPHATRREKLIHYASTQDNCLTSPDAITCFEFGPPTRLPWLMDVEIARLADPLAGVDETAVALERRTIASEHELRDDPRMGLWASRRMFPALFPAGHPYARALGTSPSRGDRLTLAEARLYAAKNFRPERMTLLVTAPVGLTSLDAIVKHLPPSLVNAPAAQRSDKLPAPAEIPSAPEKPAGPVLRLPSPLPTTQLWLGWTLPGWYDSRGPMEALLARWIQQDLGLEQLRQEDTHIRHVRVSIAPGLKASALLVSVLLDEGADPDRIDQIVSGRAASLWTREAAERPLLDRIKATFATELVLGMPSQSERAVEQAELIAFRDKPILRSDYLVGTTTISNSDLAKFAYQHLSQKRRQAVFFTPSMEAGATTTKRARSVGEAARSDDLFRNATAWEAMAIPDTKSPVENVTTAKLPTGLTVAVARRKGLSATAWLVFRGGYSDADLPILVELALRVRPDATDTARYRALSDRGATRDSSIEIMEFLAPDLRPALDILLRKATAPVQKWPTKDNLDKLVAYLNADLDAATEKAAAEFTRSLFGNHPLSRILSKSDLDKVTHSAVDSWVGRVHNLRNGVLIVVGDVDPADVQRFATEISLKIGSPAWVDPIPPMPSIDLRPPTDAHITSVLTPRAGALTEIRLGCLLPPMSPNQRPGYELFRLAVQERLNAALRFEKGDGYTVRVSAESVRGGTSFMQILTYVDAEDLADALTGVREHWNRWARHGFDGGELNVARWLYTGKLSLAYASNDSVAYKLLSDWMADPSLATRNEFRGNPFATETAFLNQLFATCKANAVLGLTGNEATIRKALHQAWPQAEAE